MGFSGQILIVGEGMKTIRMSVELKASPHEVYELLMDSNRHTELTGAKAEISRDVGGKFSIYEGWGTGTNKALEPDRKIVQSWRADLECWPAGHLSEVSFSLKKTKDGTRLDFVQTGIPDGCYKGLVEGWQEYYWEPMKRLLAR